MFATGNRGTGKVICISKLKGHGLLTVGQWGHLHFTSKSFHASKWTPLKTWQLRRLRQWNPQRICSFKRVCWGMGWEEYIWISKWGLLLPRHHLIETPEESMCTSGGTVQFWIFQKSSGIFQSFPQCFLFSRWLYLHISGSRGHKLTSKKWDSKYYFRVRTLLHLEPIFRII